MDIKQLQQTNFFCINFEILSMKIIKNEIKNKFFSYSLFEQQQNEKNRTNQRVVDLVRKYYILC